VSANLISPKYYYSDTGYLGGIDWIDLAQNRVKRGAPVNTVMDVQADSNNSIQFIYLRADSTAIGLL
jgi:hypothetical protein